MKETKMNYGYEESTLSNHYDVILDHLDSLHDLCKDESAAADKLRDQVEDLEYDLQEASSKAKDFETRLNTAYSQRAIVAIALAHVVIQHGGTAGVGQDDREDQPDAWRVVLYVDTPAGQLSWHIAPDDQLMLEGLPTYSKAWDGSWNSSNTQFYKGFVNA